MKEKLRDSLSARPIIWQYNSNRRYIYPLDYSTERLLMFINFNPNLQKLAVYLDICWYIIWNYEKIFKSLSARHIIWQYHYITIYIFADYIHVPFCDGILWQKKSVWPIVPLNKLQSVSVRFPGIENTSIYQSGLPTATGRGTKGLPLPTAVL